MIARNAQDRQFAKLRPARIDELTSEAFASRAEADLARILAIDPVPTPARRRRSVQLAGAGAVTAAAATAGIVLVTSTTAPSGPDASALLLASANTAEAASEGKCWYTKEYDFFGGDIDGPVSKDTADQVLEKWSCDGGQDRRSSVTSKGENKPQVSDYGPQHSKLSIGTYRVPVERLNEHTTPQAWKQEFATRHAKEGGSGHEWAEGVPDLDAYIWEGAGDLLAAEISPKARGALYRLLASLGTVKKLGERTDPLGRAGIALGYENPKPKWKQDGPGSTVVHVFDAKTGQLLVADHGMKFVYEQMGYVGKMGDRP